MNSNKIHFIIQQRFGHINRFGLKMGEYNIFFIG